jgi:DNA polymerase-4
VRYPDFTHASTAHTLAEAVDLELPFYPWVTSLLRAAWTQRRPLRLVSVKLSGVEAPAAQLEMFAQNDERRKRLAQTLDTLKAQRGSAVVVRGAQIKSDRAERRQT